MASPLDCQVVEDPPSCGFDWNRCILIWVANMGTLRRTLARMAGHFRKSRREREMADELASHFQMHIQDNLRAGMTAEEARREAVLKFGSVEAAKEELRDMSTTLWVETTLRGPPVRPAGPAPEPRLCGHRHPFAHARHRRQPFHLRRGRRPAAASPSLPRPRPHRDGVGKPRAYRRLAA